SSYVIAGPILVGIRHVSVPSVRIRDNNGFTPGGTGIAWLDAIADTPYFTLVSNGAPFATNQSPLTTLAFYDPEGVRFTYDLVFLGPLNRSPRFTSVPVVAVEAGPTYRYRPAGYDPDGDAVTFAKISGPANLNFSDTSHGTLLWTPSTSDVGLWP